MCVEGSQSRSRLDKVSAVFLTSVATLFKGGFLIEMGRDKGCVEMESPRVQMGPDFAILGRLILPPVDCPSLLCTPFNVSTCRTKSELVNG